MLQATLNIIRSVVLEVQLSGQSQAAEEAGSGCRTRSPALLQGEAELAYLTHEGLFISDALNEVQQVHNQDPATGSRGQQSRAETAGRDAMEMSVGGIIRVRR